MYNVSMSFTDIENKLREKLSYAPQLGAKIKFDFGDDGMIFIDGTQTPAVMNNEDEDADTVFLCKVDVFKSIVDGTQDPTMAYMMGKLKIKGSMGVAMKLNSLLED